MQQVFANQYLVLCFLQYLVLSILVFCRSSFFTNNFIRFINTELFGILIILVVFSHLNVITDTCFQSA